MVYLYVTLAGTLISLGLAVIAWRARPKPGTVLLTVLMLSIAQWNGTRLLALLSSDFATSVFLARAHFFGMTVGVPALFVFVLVYAGWTDLLTARTYAVLAVEPIVVNVAVWTNDAHGLFVAYARPGTEAATASTLSEIAVFGAVPVDPGPLFWAHAVYLWGLAVVTLVVVCWLAVRRRDLYRSQLAVLAVGIVITLTASLVDNVGLSPVRLTEPAFVVLGTFVTVAVVRFDFVDVTPIARNTVLEEMTSGVLVLDRDDQVVDINRTQRRMFGVETENVIGQPIETVLADLPDLYDYFESTREDTDTIAVDTDTGTYHYRVRVSPLRDGHGRLLGRVFLTDDVTEEYERRAELERQNEHLDNFASVVSHDLRNPLQAAMGYLDVALQTDDNEEYLQHIADNHRRIETIIEDVLALARQGQTIEETAPVDLAAVADRAWTNVAADEAVFENHLDEVIEADESRLTQVFENFFRNSVEHGSTGNRTESGDSIQHAGPTVTIEAVPITRESDTVINAPERGFYVADDGPGIPESERDTVFDAGVTDTKDGTGLGLSIVQSIVTAHGWSVRGGESETGGARFEVTGIEPPPEPVEPSLAGDSADDGW